MAHYQPEHTPVSKINEEKKGKEKGEGEEEENQGMIDLKKT